MVGVIARELHAVRTVAVHGEQLFLARNHRDVDQALTVGRRRRIKVLRVRDLHWDCQWRLSAVCRKGERCVEEQIKAEVEWVLDWPHLLTKH